MISGDRVSVGCLNTSKSTGKIQDEITTGSLEFVQSFRAGFFPTLWRTRLAAASREWSSGTGSREVF